VSTRYHAAKQYAPPPLTVPSGAELAYSIVTIAIRRTVFELEAWDRQTDGQRDSA